MTLEIRVRCRCVPGARFQGSDLVIPRTKNGSCLHRREEIVSLRLYETYSSFTLVFGTFRTRRSILTWERPIYCQQVGALPAPTFAPLPLTNKSRKAGALPGGCSGVPPRAGCAQGGQPPPGEGGANRRCSPLRVSHFLLPALLDSLCVLLLHTPIINPPSYRLHPGPKGQLKPI